MTTTTANKVTVFGGNYFLHHQIILKNYLQLIVEKVGNHFNNELYIYPYMLYICVIGAVFKQKFD
jgi:hypothetical protein